MRGNVKPPGPKGLASLVRNVIDLRRDPLELLTRLARDYGDLVRFHVGPQEVYLLNHPDYIRDVLVVQHRNLLNSRTLELAKGFLGEGLLTSQGECHRRQRQLVQPAFHQQHITSYGAVVADCVFREQEKWQEGATLDVGQEMARQTLAILGRSLFDAKIESEAEEIGAALATIMKAFSRIVTPFPKLNESLPFPSALRFRRAMSRLDATIRRIIYEGRSRVRDRGDLLSMLFLAQNGEAGAGDMTDPRVRDVMLSFFLAGGEAPASALTWTWYLLSRHPEVEAKLHAELDTVLSGKPPSIEDVAHLHYTEMVFAEAMRLYPPIWAIDRRVLVECEIGGAVIPARSVVVLSPYVTHHDPRFFAEPLKFEPERWTPEAQAAMPKFSYFPFSAGARACIGESFAWMEGVLVIATIAQHWRMHLAPGPPVVPQPAITLRPRHPVRMVLSRRAGH